MTEDQKQEFVKGLFGTLDGVEWIEAQKTDSSTGEVKVEQFRVCRTPKDNAERIDRAFEAVMSHIDDFAVEKEDHERMLQCVIQQLQQYSEGSSIVASQAVLDSA